uniref:Protein kinase domain-containing protein n=1 Tax=Oryza rufipogon TaxID=4529 RepID=A0A0E0QDT2_ORYRU
MAAGVLMTKPFMAAAAAALVSLLVMLRCLPSVVATTVSFNYSSFSNASKNITLQGSAALAGAEWIELTKGKGNNLSSGGTMGRMVYTPPVQLWDAATGEVASFTTRFSFNITPKNKSNKGDGMTFFLVSYPSRMPYMGYGGALGLTSQTFDNATAGDREEEEDDSEGDPIVEIEMGTGPRRFPYHILVNATKSFAAEEKLGQGGFGAVYRGNLRELGLDVAIKRFAKDSSKQGRKEYKSEIKVISRLRHRNLVQLIGWCHGRDELLLVYELVPNRSLDVHLHGNGTFLTWPMRINIVLGLGNALLYLHEEWEQCVVHRDIKPSNIMLDESFNAKLGDFGLARLIDHNVGVQTMTHPSGTPGYLDPECVITGKASAESDVYSFGVVLLEVACGRRPMSLLDNQNNSLFRLVEWVWDLYGQGVVLKAADERLNNDYDATSMECVMAVGLWCAHPDRYARPSIRAAMTVLQSNGPLPVLPSKMPVPIYAPPMASSEGQLSSSTGMSSSSLTITSITPR